MTEKEKDAFIVQLRGELKMYRDAYRLTKYQLDHYCSWMEYKEKKVCKNYEEKEKQ